MCSVDFMGFFCLLDVYILCVFNQNCGMMVMTRVTQNVGLSKTIGLRGFSLTCSPTDSQSTQTLFMSPQATF